MFLGFILQVRDENDDIVGLFDEKPEYKLMTCDDILGNSVTHKNSHKKHKIVAKWRRNSHAQTFVIKAVVVFDYKHAQILDQKLQLDYNIQVLA